MRKGLKNMWKRYQRFSRGGKDWSQWFHLSDNCIQEKWQLKNKLLNEYMSDEEYEKKQQ